MAERKLNKTEVAAQKNYFARQGLGFSRRDEPIIVTSNGLAWLFNYILDASQCGATLSQILIDAVCRHSFVGTVRDMWIVAVKMPLYDGNNCYYRVTAYLNGTGANETILDFPRRFDGVPQQQTIDPGTHYPARTPLKVPHRDSFTLQLSKEEAEILKGGGVIRIHPNNEDANTSI
jgi:hypothetical protein